MTGAPHRNIETHLVFSFRDVCSILCFLKTNKQTNKQTVPHFFGLNKSPLFYYIITRINEAGRVLSHPLGWMAVVWWQMQYGLISVQIKMITVCTVVVVFSMWICTIRSLFLSTALGSTLITAWIVIHSWAVQAGLLTPLTFARHRLGPLAAFTSGSYFLHNGRWWQWICELYTANQ